MSETQQTPMVLVPLVIGTALALLLLALPGLVQRYRPGAYRGVVRFWGDVLPPIPLARFGWMAAAAFVGIVLYLAVQTLTNGGFQQDPFQEGLSVGITLTSVLWFVSIVLQRLRSGRRDR